MKTTLDQTGRIELPDSVRAQLGVKAGDEVLLENHGDHGDDGGGECVGLVLAGQRPGP